MKRRALHLALLALCLGLVFSQDADPCKRQPFRGRCPSSSGQQQRSQFVLRYYLRGGECVSYPFGHCANDENEPKLFRYKEECEDTCLNLKDQVIEATTVKHSDDRTYATVSTSNEATDQSECQKQREQKGTARIKGGFIPECTQDGSFRDLQCEPSGESCFCVDSNGIEIPNSRNQPGQEKPNCKQIGQATPMHSNECTGGADPGPCTGQVKRWFYDEQKLECLEYTYSGCGGNGNNYPTKEACEHRCAPNNVPESQLCHRGDPYSNAAGQVVDCSSTDCPPGYKCNVGQKQSVCCKDDQKNGADELHSGLIPQHCLLPKERGPCDKFELRFYYNHELKECKYFFFGGCSGNENNFKSLESCQSFCSVPPTKESTKPSTTEAPETSRGTTRIETTRTLPTDIIPTLPDAEEADSTSTATETLPVETTTSTEQQSTITEESTTSTPPQSLIRFATDKTKQPSTTEQQTTPEQPSTAGQEGTTSDQTNSESTIGQTPSAQFETTGDSAHSTESPATTEQFTSASASTVDFETSETASSRSNTLPPPPSPSFRPRQPDSSSQTTQKTTPSTTTVPLSPRRCEHPKDAGTCSGKFDRWYWNEERRVCERFVYTGCGGTGNNFSTREECLSICHVAVQERPDVTTPDLSNLDVCDSPIDSGECRASFTRYAFDSETAQCIAFIYGGCNGNGNNFGTLEECQRKCMKDNEGINGRPITTTTLSPNKCEHPVDTGDCNGSFKRYAYDQESNECRPFTYSGCGGNGNNFNNNLDCLAECAKVQCPPEPPCDKTRCQLVTNTQTGCATCSCPPIANPPTTFIRPRLPQAPSHCEKIDVEACVEPCIIFTNRASCLECVCPIPASPRTNQQTAPKSTENNPPFAPPGFLTPDTPKPAGQRPVLPPSAPLPPGPAHPPSSNGPFKKPPPTIIETKPNVELPDEEIPNPPKAEPFPELSEKCTQHVDPVTRWHFNPVRGECESFQYGGCAGNKNHFFSLHECNIHCGRFKAAIKPTEAPDQPKRQEQATGPVIKPAFNPQAPAQPNQFQEIPRFVPVDDLNTLAPPQESRIPITQPVSPRIEAPRLPEQNNEQFVQQPSVDLPPQIPVGRQPDRFGNRFQSRDFNQRKPEFNAHLSQNNAPASFAQPRFEAQPLPNVVQQPLPTKQQFEISGNVQGPTRLPNFEVNGNVQGPTRLPNFEVNGNVQGAQRTQAPEVFTAPAQIPFQNRPLFNVDQNVVNQRPPLFNVDQNVNVDRTSPPVFNVDNDDFRKRDPQPAPTPSIEQQFIVRAQRPEIPLERDASNIAANNVPAFGAVDEAKQIEANPYATRTNAPPNVNSRYIPPTGIQRPNINDQYTPPPLILRPTPQLPPIQSFDINSQYIPPAPLTVSPDNFNGPTTTRAPAKVHMLDSHTYPPNLESQYPNIQKEPQPAPSPRLETQFVSRPPVEKQTLAPVTATTTKVHPHEAAFKAINEEPDSVEKGENADAKSAPLGKLPIRPIKEKPHSVSLSSDANTLPVPEKPHNVPVHEKPHSVSLSSAQNTLPVPEKPEKPHSVSLSSAQNTLPVVGKSASPPSPQPSSTESTRIQTTQTTTTPAPKKPGPNIGPNSVAIPSDPNSFPVPGKSTTSAPKKAGSNEPHSIALPAESKLKSETQKLVELPVITTEKPSFETTKKPEEIKASAAKTQVVKLDEKSTVTKVDKTTLPVVEVSKSTESTSSASTTTQQQTTASSTQQQLTTPQTTQKPVEQGYDAKPASVAEVHTLGNDEDLLASAASVDSASKSTNKQDTTVTAAPRASSAQTTADSGVTAEQVNQIAEKAKEHAPAPTYNATPLQKQTVKSPDEQLPLIGLSPKATIDYQTGKRFDNNQPTRVEGLPIHTGGKDAPVGNIKDLPEKIPDVEERVPVCPNGFKAMHYSNGGAIMCLPGKNQCPEKSVCYFNGIDFYCCPNEEDPYDQHIFGGYDGEELKHGYKSINRTSHLSIKSVNTHANETPKVRKSRQAVNNFNSRPLPPTAFSIDHVTNSLRFDDRPPTQITQAKFSRINPCTQPVARGNCEAAMFRYFYDISNDDCRSFVYSGCDGNENNFETKNACLNRCKLGPILTANPTTTTKRPTPVAGHCPNGQMPLGDNAPVLCGNQTDSIGCPPGYFCRVGPPDVCCPEEVSVDLSKLLSTPRGDIRRKPFVTPSAKFTDGEKEPLQFSDNIFDNAESIDITDTTPAFVETTTTEKPTTTIAPEFLVPADMCPDGSDSLPDRTCGSGFDGHSLCPRGFYCSIDRERNSRLCCRLDIQQASNIPAPPPVIAPYLGVRKANPGEAIDRGSLPSDANSKINFGFRRKF